MRSVGDSVSAGITAGVSVYVVLLVYIIMALVEEKQAVARKERQASRTVTIKLVQGRCACAASRCL